MVTRGYNLEGERFGELTVLERMPDVTGRGQGRLWLCMCDCGKTAIRSSAALMDSRRWGRAPCCQECLEELQAGRQIVIRQKIQEILLNQWIDQGTLYTPVQTERLQQAIREEMAREMGFVPRPEVKLDYLPPSTDVRPRATETRSGKLHEIGDALGVGRERIRQIEAKALRKLRHPSRSKFLVSFVNDGDGSDRPVDWASPAAGGTPGAHWAVQDQQWEEHKRRLDEEHKRRLAEMGLPLIEEKKARWWPIDVEAAKKRHAEWLEKKKAEPPPRRRNWFAWLSGSDPLEDGR